MAGLLSRLQDAAEFDSSGSFQFDTNRAAALMEKYRLPSAGYFMLHAVGAAVASAASQIQIQLRSDRFQIQFDGVPFSPSEAENCFATLWSGERDPALIRQRELALARGGASEWTRAPFCLKNIGSLQQIRVDRPHWQARLLRFLGRWGRSEEEELLAQHLVPTPQCAITLNGKNLTGLTPPQQCRQRWSLGKHDPTLSEVDWSLLPELSADQRQLLESSRGLICQLADGENSPAQFRGHQATRSYWPGYLDFVLNARLYRCPLPNPLRNWWAIIWLSGLRRDLSHTHIAAEDLQTYQDLISKLRDADFISS